MAIVAATPAGRLTGRILRKAAGMAPAVSRRDLSMTIAELRTVLDTAPPEADARATLRRLFPPARRAPAAPALRYTPQDTAGMTDAALRAYCRQRDLYDSARFHAQYGAPGVVDWAGLAADIERDGPRPAYRARYWAGVAHVRSAEVRTIRSAASGHPDDRIMAWQDRSPDGAALVCRTFRRADVPEGWRVG